MKVNLLPMMLGQTKALIASDPGTQDWLDKIKLMSPVHGDVSVQRNGDFHKKLFALFKLSFDYWEPGKINSKYGKPEKSFDRFRKDLTILAGHYNVVIRLDGSVRIEADSLNFSKMNQEAFDNLYKNVLSVVLKKIPVLSELGIKETETLVEKILRFC